MNKVMRYNLYITLRAPFLIPATQVSQLGLDASQMMISENGVSKAIIPGDLVKGLLRHAMSTLNKKVEKLKTSDIFTQIFGQDVEDDKLKNQGHKRGNIVISDLTAHKGLNYNTSGFLNRVRILKETGVAENGHLQFIEQLFEPGETVEFSGTLTLFNQTEEAKEWLQKALKLIPALGANKSVGFGEVDGSPILKSISNTDNAVKIYADQVAVKLRFDHPVMFSNERISQNVFRSQEIIPGATLKAALAASLSKSAYLCKEPGEALRKMRFSFAFPISDDRPIRKVIPLSLIIDPDQITENGSCLVDAAFNDNEISPYLVNDKVFVTLASAKKELRESVMQHQNYTQEALPTEVRTRTSINAKTNTAKSGNLFSYEMINPKNIAWEAIISRNGADFEQYQSLINSLANGLHRVGKTETWANVEIEECTKKTPALPSLKNKKFSIQLTTPALIIDKRLDDLTQSDLFSFYQQYWNDMSDGKLILKNIFTREQLYGGFLAFQYRCRQDKSYYPYILTEPGSVFVFEGDFSSLEKFTGTGLPLPEWVETHSAQGKILCPFEPQNGYGSFVFDPCGDWDLQQVDNKEYENV